MTRPSGPDWHTRPGPDGTVTVTLNDEPVAVLPDQTAADRFIQTAAERNHRR